MDSEEIIDKLQGRSIFPWNPRAGQEYVMWDYEENKYIIFAWTFKYSVHHEDEGWEWLPIGYGLLP